MDDFFLNSEYEDIWDTLFPNFEEDEIEDQIEDID
jgi:hypothetical protein